MPSILVVDDDPFVRRFVRDCLEQVGYAVDTVSTGSAALHALNDQRPDCVVLDDSMPGLDGHAVLRMLRTLDGGNELPVVMLSSATDPGQAWRAWSEGVDYVLAKPVDPRELLRYLDYLFARSSVPAGC